MRLVTGVLFCGMFAACGGKTPSGDTGAAVVDADQDGYPNTVDCDDFNNAINPDAVEICDGLDNNCDGTVDEPEAEDALIGFADADGDGYGDPDDSVTACELPDGYVDNDLDCADDLADVNPDGVEVCNEIDDDCDTEVDEDATDMSSWFVDSDADGYGDDASVMESCAQPSGTAELGGDCDDADGTINPGAAEICDGIDNDCSEATTEEGTALWVDSNGVSTDVTVNVTGTSASPAQFTIPEGDVTFCDGTFYVNLMIEGSATVGSFGADPAATMLDGGEDSGSVVRVFGDGLDVSLSDLTLQNGEAQPWGDWSGTLGGGIDCMAYDGVDYGLGDVALTLDNLIITGNSADFGGGIVSHNCSLTISNTDIEYNTAALTAGAMYIADGQDHALTSVTIDNNRSEVDVGGVYVTNQFKSDVITGKLDSVVFSNNSAASNFGAVLAVDSDFEWTGIAGGGDSGFWNNSVDDVTTDFPGAFTTESADFVFDTVDFGEPGSGNDNSAHDITLYDTDGQEWSYVAGDDASFECDYDGCGVATEATLAGSEYVETGGYYTFNLIESDTNGTLNGFSIDTNGTSSQCRMKMAVLGISSLGSSGTNTWDVLWESDLMIASTNGITESGPIGILVEDGSYYGLAFGPTNDSCDFAFNYDFYSSNSDAGFGTGLAYGFVSEAYDLWGDTTVTEDFLNEDYGAVFHMDISSTEL